MMPAGIEVLSLREVGFEQEIEETGMTLEANSGIKARTVWEWLRQHPCEQQIDGVFADDTGLEIDALGGAPGVFTARWYSLPKGTVLPLRDEKMIFKANREKALRELAGKEKRDAQFRTVITLIRDEENRESEEHVEGIVRGRIAEEERGEGGFGYDPVFIPEGYKKSFGELPAEIKNTVSHRARAMEALVKKLRAILMTLLCVMSMGVQAERWISHLAYNNVTQIAMTPEVVYGLSDGSLFSVNKQTEAITKLTNLSSTGVNCIAYDERGEQLVIGYQNGKIDILDKHGVYYISALYEKDMTQRKTVHNITIDGYTAYLSTPFGVQTMDMRERKLVDSYWLRPGGQEIDIEDVIVTKDSIYAFSSDSLFCAAKGENLTDYRSWRRERRSARIQPDSEKGKHYQDRTAHWYAGGAEGIVRESATERIGYKPQGPLSNMPYRMSTMGERLWVVPGGRWASQNRTPGEIMIYDGERWTNIPQEQTESQTGHTALDFMNVAVDPQDIDHFYVTSYGTGLYEYRGSTVVRQVTADGTNPMTIHSNPLEYTRLDGAVYDKDRNLWFVRATTENQLHCIDTSGEWHGMNVSANGIPLELHTPCGLIIDNTRPNCKWLGTARYNTFLCLMDDGGTRFDTGDDRTMVRSKWVNQQGREFAPSYIRTMIQDRRGRVWLGTDIGVAYIPQEVDYFNSNAIVQPQVTDENGENPVTDAVIYAICEDSKGNIWVGSEKLGVYVLNPEGTEIIAHYTTGNSAMPSNSVLSLACDERGNVFVGTGEGLAQYDPNSSAESTDRTIDAEGKRLGSLMQWKLHFSYLAPKQVVAGPDRIYAVSNGALWYVDRADDTMHYLSKSSGLNGSSVSHAAYDKSGECLVIAYEDGRIDLLEKDGYIRQMPDLHMKASSVAVEVNAIHTGSRNTYLAMPFGILAINTRKGEISDTYYIGEQAGDVDVKEIVESGDSLYAFTNGYMYAASMEDNLVDYHFWHRSPLPGGKMTHAGIFREELHILVDSVLYHREQGVWVQAATKKLSWIHASEGRLLAYIRGEGLFQLTEEYQLAGLTDRYAANDAICSQGEYWIAEEGWGLIRLSTQGDLYFHPDGPNSNFGYYLHSAHGKVYATVGGRWASQFFREGKVNICEGGQWTAISPYQLIPADGVWPFDPVSIAVTNDDPDHFYIATYCAGVFEYNHGNITRYGDGTNGCTIKRTSTDITPVELYTRTEGATMDAEGNLWVLNATSIGEAVHVMSPDHRWHALRLYTGGQKLTLTTPKGIWIDRASSRRKWFMDQRYSPGLILLDDGGTPTENYDDRCIKRSLFVDQQGKSVQPAYYYCITQDQTGRLWVGTESGILLFNPETDFFTSNACQRIIIPRNDGTGLGDYLLGEEQINCIAVDGGNRVWIGTAGSGLYLIEDDTITVAHFTDNNSMIPSNNILSIAIVPETGEVFVGTDKGIASYLSDASEAEEDMSNAYAYPNPVRPDYGGSVAVKGLMENSEVNIIDSGGNLVCKTRSHGGTAVWNGRLPDGRRATPGVYTALCNAKGGKKAIKILFLP